ncbi:MAG: hypothetical protein EU531_08705 [Promethearchaeota archaeon]|nr:MAG: hypothetical protein EU531_08705 [Candidatus Lokiarchaeota archaeon]
MESNSFTVLSKSCPVNCNLSLVTANSLLVSLSCFSKSLTFARRSNKKRPSTDCFLSGFSSALAQSIDSLFHL